MPAAMAAADPAVESEPLAAETLRGTVVDHPSGELMILTETGEAIQIGAGPYKSVYPDFTLAAGDAVEITGYHDPETGEFKAMTMTRLQDGYTVQVRDQSGRPAWAGGGQDRGDASGEGEAEVDAWVTIDVTVVSVEATQMAVATADGEELSIDGRTWSFALQSGFQAAVGDTLQLTGFYENGEFEIGALRNLTTGLEIAVRGETGRPLWAGGGRW